MQIFIVHHRIFFSRIFNTIDNKKKRNESLKCFTKFSSQRKYNEEQLYSSSFFFFFVSYTIGKFVQIKIAYPAAHCFFSLRFPIIQGIDIHV